MRNSRDSALETAKTLEEERTKFRVYSLKDSQYQFQKDCLEWPRDQYRVSILEDDIAQRVLKKYKILYDPVEMVVVSYTLIEKKQDNPFAIENLQEQ
ncbi:hypothetical protein HYX13_02500 [Candidatus Woesearchaeota archaeon]|nr:hypothetical protein [Candidatus Woesearchaeota archaeon]